MVKNHLKRIAAPKSWDIKRKSNKYILRPEPSGHKMDKSITITMLFRDLMKRAKTVKEMKYILSNKEILLNSKKIESYKASIGLMDVVSIPETKENYRIVFDKKGQLVPVGIDAKEAKLVPMMIANKTKIGKGKTQINFTNGNNLLVEKDEYRTKDVLVIDIEKNKIVDYLKVEKGSVAYFISGKYVGTTATVEDIKEESVVFKKDKEVFETDKRSLLNNVFVVGKNGSLSINVVG